MKRIHSNKRGFTLVEMMLALAIIVIIGWTTVALMMATKDSFMTTYNTNDSSDYAVLYANGIENTFLSHTQYHTATTLGINPASSKLEDNNKPVFDPMQMKTKRVSDGAEVNKWEIRVYFYVDPSDKSSLLKYKIFVVDNYYSPSYKIMAYQDCAVWAPHIATGKVTVADTYSASSDPVDAFIRSKSSDYGLTSEYKNSVKYAP